MAIALQQRLLLDYNNDLNHSGVQGERLAKRLEEIAAIGQTEEGGSYRIGFSSEEQQAKAKIIGWMQALGMKVYQDGAMNVFGYLQGTNPDLPAIMCGSHVDTVPNGGHFDGALGVLATLEVIEAWRDTNKDPERTVILAIFTDEEGACFQSGFTGSKAVTGAYQLSELLKLRDEQGNSFTEVLELNGTDLEGFQHARQKFDDIALFVEMHIEQGKRLEKAGLPCGIVTGIAGPRWLEVTFTGEADHAGNTPMGERQDALVAASDFISILPRMPENFSQSAVATVGKLNTQPNGINVIPGKVTLFVDIRDIYEDKRDALTEAIIQQLKKAASDNDVQVAWQERSNIAPVLIEEELIQKWEQAFTYQGLETLKLPSGAGHDAMIMHEKVPVTMLFVQSKNGRSHHPAEWSELNDCVQSIHVLKQFLENYE